VPPSPEPSRAWIRRRCLPTNHGDDGFTLIEVMVAFLIIAVIAAAGTSLTVRGLRATLEAKQLSQAQNLVNEQVEEMRGLPYFVANTTSTAKVDVLDGYYPNVTPPAAAPTCGAKADTWLANKTAWSGYVVSTAARCPFEPPVPFYRTVVDPAAGDTMKTAIVVSTQFLGLATGKGMAPPVVAPSTDYAWNTSGKDSPASSQIAATVTAVFGPTGGAVRHSTSRTDIADRRGGPPQVSAETNAGALAVEGTMSTGEARRLELGTVAGNGAVTAITKAAVEAVGGSMQTEAGRLDGAAQIAGSPGSVSGNSTGGGATSGSMSLGSTHTSGVTATSTVSDPGYGNPAVAGAVGGTFGVDQVRPELGLDADKLVWVDSGTLVSMAAVGGCPATNPTLGDRAAGSGWMNTGVASPKTLAACARSGASTVKLFKAPGAPDGLIQVEASNVRASCDINGATPTAATSGLVKVSWLTGPSTYQSTTVTLNGTTVTGSPIPALTTSLIGGKTIGDYIGGWDAFSGVQLSAQTVNGVRLTSARVPAALTLATVALRKLGDGTPDPDSAVKVTIGRALCSATDRR
jgi:prepilin-type N-terminal cleavage/methylation domain-containing protein